MALPEPEKVASYEPLTDNGRGIRVVIRRLAKGKMSEGGTIHIPDSAQEFGRLAEVIAVGPSRITEHGVVIEPSVAKGDIVLTALRKGADLQHGGHDLQILDNSDCQVRVKI